MRVDETAGLPPRPESVGEWEDLLVRLEIVPRVVRNTVDDGPAGDDAVRLLRAAMEREAAVGRWLEAASGLNEPGRPPFDPGSGADAADLALRFASLRARTFAMVQRRGLEVWQWSAPLGDGGSATVHQVLLWLSARDADLLSGLRAAAIAARVAC
jgi:hypothetical protein